MCVVEWKTKTHSDGRQSRKERVRYCHAGLKKGSLCDHVERKNVGAATISDTKPSSSSNPSSSADLITTGKDGKERIYRHVTKKVHKRSSLGTSGSNTRPSSDVTSPPSSPSVREVRPGSTSQDDPVYRRSVKYSYPNPPDPNRTVGPDGTAIYDRPPSLDMPRANGPIEYTRPNTTTADVREVSPSRSTYRRRRPSNVIIDTGASMTSTTPSVKNSSPGLSHLPRLNRLSQDSGNALPIGSSKGKQRARVDSLADDDELEAQQHELEAYRQANLERQRLADSERYQQERMARDIEAQDQHQARLERERLATSERRQADRLSRQQEARDKDQARLERERLAESDRRQVDRLNREAEAREVEHARQEVDRLNRIRMSQEAEAQARARAEEARRDHHRQETAAALERAEEDAEHKRRIDAEYNQMARERRIADAQRLASAAPQQHYEPRSMPVSPRGITYATGLPPPTISARQTTSSYVTTSPISARYPVTIHNYSSGPTDSLRERGNAVVAQAQAAAARSSGRRLSVSMGEMDLGDDEIDAAIETQMGRSSSRRHRGGVRDRERVRERRYERQQEW